MTFTEWLVARRGEDSPIGDLARDVVEDIADGNWPGGSDLPTLLRYLDSQGTVEDAVETLCHAWAVWHLQG